MARFGAEPTSSPNRNETTTIAAERPTNSIANRRAAARHTDDYWVVDMAEAGASDGRRISLAVMGQRSSGKWQAARWSEPKSRSSGSSTSHLPSWKRGQRGWKRQASGGL